MRFDGENRDNPLYWRLRIGRLFGITIYLHLLFLIGAAIVVAEALMPAREGYYHPTILQSFGQLGILFFIVLVHEFGHCFGARASGGDAEEILLWPLGGLASVHPKHTPRAHFITTAAGPLVNVIFCMLSGAFLVLYAGASAIPWNPLYALARGFQAADPVRGWVTVFFALSYIILLFNLLPIYPLDGGRLLHALLWPGKGYRDATLIATRVGLIGAVVLGIFGILTGSGTMIVIALFGGITCYNDRRALRMGLLEETSEFGYDFSKGYQAFDETAPARKPGYFARRRQARAEARRVREADDLRRQQEEVDRILAKIRRDGMGSLTAAERRILERETERQRAGE